MSYKTPELNRLKQLVSLGQQQANVVCNFLGTIDDLHEVPIVTDALSIQEMVHSTTSFLTLTNTILLEEVSELFGRQIVTPEMINGLVNMPNAVAHTLNLDELDRDFEEELEDDDDSADGDEPTAKK